MNAEKGAIVVDDYASRREVRVKALELLGINPVVVPKTMGGVFDALDLYHLNDQAFKNIRYLVVDRDLSLMGSLSYEAATDFRINAVDAALRTHLRNIREENGRDYPIELYGGDYVIAYARMFRALAPDILHKESVLQRRVYKMTPARRRLGALPLTIIGASAGSFENDPDLRMIQPDLVFSDYRFFAEMSSLVSGEPSIVQH